MQRGCLFSTVVLLAVLGAAPALAQSTTLAVVNAASYGGTIAPDSLATVFGNGLAPDKATATLDGNGQLPTVLLSTSVEIDGVPAPLVYVSPTQINLLVPGGVSTGTVTVMIRSTASGATKSGTALVAASMPGVFASDGSGSGPGSILNAATYSTAPFLVLTGNGTDARTRLAVYGTGLRHADTVTATAQDSSGNRYPLTVEYAGEAPGYFGLDQVNVLLPPDLDGAGAVSLALSADGNAANLVTFQMNQIDASQLHLSSLALSADFVSAGDSTTLTVGLNGVARTGGFAVGLRSNNAVAQVTTQITIPTGKASAQTTVTTSAVTGSSTAQITAQAAGDLRSVSLGIDPANSVQLSSLTTSETSIRGGRSLTGTVTLTGNSPSGNVNILLASDSTAASVPAQVTVPFTGSSASFNIATQAVTKSQVVTLTATLGRSTVSATLNVRPPLELVLSPSQVVGGNPVSGTVTLGEAAASAGAIVTVSSNDASVKAASVAIPGGQSSQSFTLTTAAVNATRTVSITAGYAGATQTVPLTVTPAAAATLAGLTISPSQVNGGSSAQGTVTLSAPAGNGGMRVDLQSSVVTTATVPMFVFVPQGQTSATFTIATTGFPNVVTITASAGGIRKTASLTVR